MSNPMPNLFAPGAKLSVPNAGNADTGAAGYGYIIATSDSRMALEEYESTSRVNPERHLIFDHDAMQLYEQTERGTTYLSSTTAVKLIAPPWASKYDRIPRGILHDFAPGDYEYASNAFRTVPVPRLSPPDGWPDDCSVEPLPREVQAENLATALHPPVDLSFAGRYE